MPILGPCSVPMPGPVANLDAILAPWRDRGALLPPLRADADAAHRAATPPPLRLPPAERLVCLLVRPVAERALVGAVIAAGIDWRRVLELATRHRVLALCARGLAEAGPSGLVPDDVRRALAERVRLLALNNLLLAGAADQALRQLDAAGIPALVVKGPAVALACHGDLGLRPFSDLDLLVRREDARAAASVLERLGYRAGAALEPLLAAFDAPRISSEWPCANEASFLSRDGRVTIDLHWGLHPRCLQLPADDPALWRRTRLAGGGGALAFRTLSPIDTFVHLCVHAGRDGWKCLAHVCDLVAWQQVHPDIPLAAVCEQAVRQRCVRLVRVGWLLAHQLRGMATDPHAAVTPAERRLLAGLWRGLFATAPSSLRRNLRSLANTLGLRDRRRDGLGQCLLTARVALTRTAEGPPLGSAVGRASYRLIAALAGLVPPARQRRQRAPAIPAAAPPARHRHLPLHLASSPARRTGHSTAEES